MRQTLLGNTMPFSRHFDLCNFRRFNGERNFVYLFRFVLLFEEIYDGGLFFLFVDF